MKKEKINTFNVLHMNFTTKKVEPYNVLPYFRDCWRGKYNKDEKDKKWGINLLTNHQNYGIL